MKDLCWELKSSSSPDSLIIFPTLDMNNFIFLMNAKNYIENKDDKDLFMFIRIFLQNCFEKNPLSKEIWIPMFTKKCILVKNIDFASIFPEKRIFTNLEISLNFKDYLGGRMVPEEPN